MFATMPQTPPTFAFGRPGQGHNHHHHRPNFSSPLSSSPIRASSLSPPPFPQYQHQQTTSQPLSPCNPNSLNTLPRHTQSSPILGTGSTQSPFNENATTSTQNNNTKFRFATRPPRPNPVLKRREDAQEGRRRLFFQNVRQRQEDKRWDMRGGEDELLKLEWWRLHRERTQAKEAEVAQYELLGMLDADADAVAREEEEMRMQQMRELELEYPPHQNMDALMADAIAQQEEAEMEALVEALEGQGASGSGSGQFSDDEDYDGLFMDLIQQEGQGMGHSQDVEMS